VKDAFDQGLFLIYKDFVAVRPQGLFLLPGNKKSRLLAG
jgi:hypothetical protein